jgi:CDP-paratose 2-epimerase
LTRGVTHKLGICQWFHYEAHGDVKRAVAEMRALGLSRLRTGISWAEYHRTGGPAWYDWLFEELAGFELLVSIWHTPPSIADRYTCASPPERLTDYGSFVGLMIDRYGHRFWDIELWNEPHNLYKADLRQCDPCWSRLGEMIAFAAEVAQSKGKRTVLGGVMPEDDRWLELMRAHGALAHVDVVAVQGFPEMWWERAPSWDQQSRWHGWDEKIARSREHSEGKPIWVTETGLATWDVHGARTGRYRRQAELLRQAAQSPAERVYWHSLIDLDPARDAAQGYHVDENEYHLGLVSWEGDRKPAWGIMKHLLAEEGMPLMAPPDPAGAVSNSQFSAKTRCP